VLHETPLIARIVAGIGLAFIFGTIANRLRLPPLVGYLVAGIYPARTRQASSPIKPWHPNWRSLASYC
jgi:predicted Kef-type K+ transport protein